MHTAKTTPDALGLAAAARPPSGAGLKFPKASLDMPLIAWMPLPRIIKPDCHSMLVHLFTNTFYIFGIIFEYADPDNDPVSRKDEKLQLLDFPSMTQRPPPWIDSERLQ